MFTFTVKIYIAYELDAYISNDNDSTPKKVLTWSYSNGKYDSFKIDHFY